MKLYNSLSRTEETFVPLEEGTVKMYTCGPTVYNFAHIGNLRTYIHEDILQKTLEYNGYDVTRVMNITDVGHLESDADDGEDKMLKGAQRENKTVWEIAQFYTDAFFGDCEKLKIKRPAILGKATNYINDYIEFIQTLENKGFTYTENGNVYFDISKVDDYTKLSGMNLEELQTASRDGVTIDTNKRNPQDFVLWFTKSKFENQAMKWDSPWGIGYPGWHIECSVISLKNLGNCMDIHCGGIDHIPVHHTNELAQTESYTGTKWVNYWWHSEFLLNKEGKMSKSSGEFLTVDLLIKKGFNPLAYRYFVLNSHYRKQLAFSFDSLKQAESAYIKLRNKAQAVKKDADLSVLVSLESPAVAFCNQSFTSYISDDLNTANAITVLHSVFKSKELTTEEKYFLINRFEEVLSLGLLEDDVLEIAAVNDQDTTYIEEMLLKRTQAKQNKDYAKSDEIRDELLERGIAIKDTPQGPTWRYIN